jgi:hypothetical protein
MALFMDTHTIEGGVAAADVAAAHQADLTTQGPHGAAAAARLLAADVDNPALHALLD